MTINAAAGARLVLVCDCQGTMPLDRAGPALACGCPGLAPGAPATELCGAQSGRAAEALAAAAAGGPAVTIACTHRGPTFAALAEQAGAADALALADIRERAGWSDEGAAAGPKMAALIAMAAVPAAPYGQVGYDSGGVALILGGAGEAAEVAMAAARALAASLDITVVLAPGAAIAPPNPMAFPVWQGRIAAAQGHLGGFVLTVDAFAAPVPSSRAVLRFGPARNGAVSRADLVVDLTGGRPLFAGDALRPGYLRADPRDAVAVARLIDAARQLEGHFDKPRFIDFRADLCAHSRNRITGCTRCLDVCPAGAITPAGDTVAIDPMICAGCGGCSAVCPTGAAGYAVPPPATVAAQLRAGLAAWHAAAGPGDDAAVVLFHDDSHGAPLLDALAQAGPGLPARVLPVALTEVTRLGPELIFGAQAWGAAGVAVLAPARPRHDRLALDRTLALAGTVAAATGRPAPELIATDDPDALAAATRALPRAPTPAPTPAARSSFAPPADKRGLLVAAAAEAIRCAPAPRDTLALEPGAPFGAIAVDPDACTLCMACTGACPTGALIDNPEAPMLRFTETACVQCGLCAATCPEDAISLQPRIDLDAWDRPRRVLHEEPPFACTRCAKPFATASAIRRVQDRLAGHWMYAGPGGPDRLALLTLCEDCRVVAAVEGGVAPHREGA